jgi:hypothetical protein
MKCDQIKNKMMDYLFAELDEIDSKQFDAHIKSCQTCKTELAEFQSTVDVAEKWPEIEPKRDIVFVTPKTNLVEKVIHFLKPNQEKSGLRWIGRLGFAGLILIVFFLRSEIHFSQGQFSLRIGSNGTQAAQLNNVSPEMVSALKSLQKESLLYTQQMIRDSEQRQRSLLFTGLNQISDKIDQTRKVDLNYVGENLQRLDRNNSYNFDKTAEMLQNVLKVTTSGYPIKK